MIGQTSVPASEARRQTAIVVLGLALIASAILVGFVGASNRYEHSVWETSDPPIEEGDPNFYHFSDLPPDAQDAFLTALEHDTVVRTADPVAPEFRYPPGSAAEIYVVEYRGTTYGLETQLNDSPAYVIENGVWLSLALGAVLILAVGGLGALSDTRRDRVESTLRIRSEWVLLWGFLVVTHALLSWITLQVLETSLQYPIALSFLPHVILAAVATLGFVRMVNIDGSAFATSVVLVPIILIFVVAGIFQGGGPVTVVVLVAGTMASVAGYLLGYGLYGRFFEDW